VRGIIQVSMPSIPYDSLTLAAVVHALQPLQGGRIQHIAQPAEHDILLTVYVRGMGEVYWLISCSPQWARTHLLSHRLPNPPQPPPFCMALRKYLQGGTILTIAQRRFDRVLDVEVKGHEGHTYLLSAELMGRHSNMILIAPDERILHAAKLVSSRISRVREVLPGRAYTPPPAEERPDPRAVSESQFLQWYQQEQPADFAAWLRSRFEGIGTFLAGEIAARAQRLGNGDTPAVFWSAFRSVFDAAAAGDWEPVLVRDEAHRPIGAYPIPLASLPEEQQHPRRNIHVALENYYAVAIPRAELEQQKRSLQGILQRVLTARRNALQQLQQGVEERAQADIYRRWGETLLAFLSQVPKGVQEVTLRDLYSADGATLTIPLDPTLTPQENAQRYFARARHVEQNAERLEAMRYRLMTEEMQAQEALQRLESISDLSELEAFRREVAGRGWLNPTAGVSGEAATRTQEDFEGRRIRVHVAPGGWQVLVGENAEANDYLVTRVAQPNDWWLHVRAGTGAHVVIRTNNHPQAVPRQVLEFAARLAAANSPQRHSSIVPVDYTLRKYVRRPRGAPPGFVTYTHEKTLHVSPRD
jgi:predicted ribosome quality control (RQC) complex YloA/Tae2 family protein